jgi:ribosomal-protein-alanine N-acetyltransferase
MSEHFRVWQGGLGDAVLLACLHAPAFSDAWPEPAFASLLAREEVTVLLGACADSPPQGFILMRTVVDESEVLTFCVAQSARRHGLGRALLDAACNAVRERGAVHVFLEVSAKNDAALGLYREAGFVEVGRRGAYYHQGSDASDALVMRRILNQDTP